MYYFYLDKVLLPVAPEKLQLKINNNNKTLTLINNGEINILKDAKLTDISFEILLPNSKYPFAMYKDGFKKPIYYLDKLEKLKISKKPFQFIVSRKMPTNAVLFDTNMQVSLEDYKITEEAKQGFDIKVSVNLKQYKQYSTKTMKITIKQAR